MLLPQGALVAHIGDSRIYRLRGDLLEQLTFDHSLVWEMAAAGQMAEADVPSYIPKNVITRSLGPHPSVHIDLEGPYSAESGDKFLICSDGLSGPITDEEIGVIAAIACAPDDAAETLVDLANFRGGPDNISVVVAQVDGAVPPAAMAHQDVANAPPSATLANSAALDCCGRFPGDVGVLRRERLLAGRGRFGHRISWQSWPLGICEIRSIEPQTRARRFSRLADHTAMVLIARQSVRRIAKSSPRSPKSPQNSASNPTRITAIAHPIGKRSKHARAEAAALAEKGDYAGLDSPIQRGHPQNHEEVSRTRPHDRSRADSF